MNRYQDRGVSATKEDVHAVVDKMDKGLYPGAFCKITEDYLTNDKTKANIIHSDGSGTKSILGYLYYRETGDAGIFKGIAQDSVVMNIDDLLCAGITDNILISSTINRNAKSCGAEVLKNLILGTEEFLDTLRSYGLNIRSGGGETADVGDLTPTIVVDTCAVAVFDRTQVVDNDQIRENDVIIGLASFGQAKYETSYNSGIGSNGLTSARHELLSSYYAQKYPETFDANMPHNLAYCGPFVFDDKLPGSGQTVGEAILSPTRTYVPVIAKALKEFRPGIHGLVHCSGGGQTKCLRFGRNKHYIKDNLFDVPPIFEEIRKASGTSWEEMFKVYNMGHRMEIFADSSIAADLIDLSKSFGIDAQIIGKVKQSASSDNQITIIHKNGTCEYGLHQK